MTLGVGYPSVLLLILNGFNSLQLTTHVSEILLTILCMCFSCNSINFVWRNSHALCADVCHVEQWCYPSDPAVRHVWLDHGETVHLDAPLLDLALSRAKDATHAVVTVQTVAMGICRQPSTVAALEEVKKWQDKIMKSLKKWWRNILIRNSALLPHCGTGNCQNLARCSLLKGGRLVTGSTYHVDSEWS